MSNLNPLEMSDEDFMNAPPFPEVEEQEEELETSEEELDEEVEQEEETDSEDSDDSDDNKEDPDESEEDSGGEEDEPTGEDDDATEESDEDDPDEDKKPKEEEENPEEQEEGELSDAEKQLAKLFAPFKANGREIKIDSVEDAIQLMQMGANYSKKMAAMKPGLRVLKMLEQNDLLDEGKLSFLIDISKKKPEAISKLLKDSGLDPLDIDLDKSNEYKPGTYNVSDSEIAVESILDEIKDTASYRRTLDIVSNKWDESSRQIIVQNPELIKVINDHVGDGTYDQIYSVVEKERMLGRLTGVSDLQAYKIIGDRLFGNPQQQQPAPVPAGHVVAKSTPTKANDDSKLKSRKKAASPTKAAPSSSKKDDDFNPLSLSDEEFEKIVANNYR